MKKDVVMKYQCDFCKSDDVETLLVDGEVIVMCHVCNVETVVEYPDSINYLESEVNDEYALNHRVGTIKFHV